MASRCATARKLIARRRSGLSAAERLRLEEHVTACTACCEEARALDAFAQMIDVHAAGGRPSRHARAITRVLNATSEAEIPAPAPASPSRAAPYLLAGAMAIAGILGVAAHRAGWGTGDGGPGEALPTLAAADELERPAGPPEPPVSSDEPEPLADRLDAGDLRMAGAAVAPGASIRPGSALSTDGGAELALGAAIVELEAGGSAVWDLDRTTLRLERGVVRARVEPEERSRFRVVTDRFAVEVIGTEFEVTSDGVAVEQGTVRVTSPEGEVFAARLEAGESWSVDELPRAEPEVDVSERLARARTRLARGDVRGARALIREARRADPSRVERAEAETLLAESALVAGDRARAAERYLAVAESYARLSAGENALFAAARIERELGHDARAAELFERYINRYPNGRFRADAELRLKEAERR